ncbi:MAG: hypothetical protein HXY40_08725 [Chloroflexi bacterium]|nr:hypothetical protein [Chloroflexota bacterium]
MTLSEAWDRMFWMLMLIIFVGLLWMRFVQDTLACEGPGLIVAVTIGIVFFATGWRSAAAQKRRAAAEAAAAREREA